MLWTKFRAGIQGKEGGTWEFYGFVKEWGKSAEDRVILCCCILDIVVSKLPFPMAALPTLTF